MKLSYNWLNDLWKGNLSPEEIGALLTSCGLETEGIEEYHSIAGNLNGLIIGEVVEKWQHPDADRLSLTRVNIGQEELLQIVCGAPNVAQGQKVVVAPVGCVLYPVGAEPWEIKKGKIRGQSSEGMLCAADEIGLGDDHSGILVLPQDAPVGTPVNEYLDTYRDHILEIGLTPNRGDAASVLGVARDLQALTGIPPQWPESMAIPPGKGHISIELQNNLHCPRYTGLYIKDIKICPSPDWMQNRLKAIGIKPKNIVVDSTNFVLHELGQPIHAFDAAKIQGGIVVRTAKSGEKLVTLDEVDRTMIGHELLICDHQKPLALAGVFGGLSSGVTDDTSDIFIESAYFSPEAIRKAAKSHGLHTDASFRYERGTDPDITVFAAQRVAHLITTYAGGQIIGNLDDVYPNQIPSHTFSVRLDRINALSGTELNRDLMIQILKGLDIEVKNTNKDEWELVVPSRKHDVTREIDIVEEILRIYGYDRVPFPGQIRYSGNSGQGKSEYRIRQRASSFLVANGFNEILTNPLSTPEKQSAEIALVQLRNPLSYELSVLRNRMAATCLEAISYNIHRKNSDLKLFEFGRVYEKKGDTFEEREQLILMVTGDKFPESWNQKSEKSGYFYLKAMVEEVLKKSGLNQNQIVYLDAVSKDDLSMADIKQEVWMALIQWEPKKDTSFEIEPIRKFPEVRRDLSLVLQSQVDYAQIEAIARKSAGKRLIGMNLFDAFEGKPLEAGTKSYAVSFVLYDDSHTLTDKEIDQIMQKLIRNFEQEAGAFIRR